MNLFADNTFIHEFLYVTNRTVGVLRWVLKRSEIFKKGKTEADVFS